MSSHGTALLRLTGLPQPSHAAAFPVDHLALEQQRDALLEGELLGGRVGHLLTQGEGHPVELQAVQCIEGGLDEHGSSCGSGRLETSCRSSAMSAGQRKGGTGIFAETLPQLSASGSKDSPRAGSLPGQSRRVEMGCEP